MVERVAEASTRHSVSPRPDTIVVGVADRPGGVERALWEAALWATRQHLDVTLLTTSGPSHGPASSATTHEGRRRALQLIDGAAHRLARATDGGQRISTAVATGPADAALLAASASAALLVLQHGGERVVAPPAAGSTTGTVTGQSACPVLVVHDDDQTAVRRGVTVVLDTPGSAASGLGAAFPEAVRRGQGLTVAILSSSLDPHPRDWWASVPDEDQLGVWRRRFAKVKVTEMALNRFDWPALQQLISGCELLVVARRDNTRDGKHPLSVLARRLIGGARCPVLVVPPTADRRPDPWS